MLYEVITIQLGETGIRTLHTPGHTPGSACYQVGDELITGDTLFVFGCGRCDLRGGDPEQMFVTLKDMAARLPASTIIRPGHRITSYNVCYTKLLRRISHQQYRKRLFFMA